MRTRVKTIKFWKKVHMYGNQPQIIAQTLFVQMRCSNDTLRTFGEKGGTRTLEAWSKEDAFLFESPSFLSTHKAHWFKLRNQETTVHD